jgi:hypothetical protein
VDLKARVQSCTRGLASASEEVVDMMVGPERTTSERPAQQRGSQILQWELHRTLWNFKISRKKTQIL